MMQNLKNYSFGNGDYYLSISTKGQYLKNYGITAVNVGGRVEYDCKCYDYGYHGACKHIDSLREELVAKTVGDMEDLNQWLLQKDRLTRCLSSYGRCWVNPMKDLIEFKIGGVVYTYEVKTDILVRHKRGESTTLTLHDQIKLGLVWVEKFQSLV